MMNTIKTVQLGQSCLMGWAGPHLTDSPMSAACQCRLKEGHEGRHLCLTMGCNSWRRQRAGDPVWKDGDDPSWKVTP